MSHYRDLYEHATLCGVPDPWRYAYLRCSGLTRQDFGFTWRLRRDVVVPLAAIFVVALIVNWFN